MANDSKIHNSLRLLKTAPDNQFSVSAKLLVKDWDNKTSPSRVKEVIEQVKKHRLGSNTSVHLLTSIMFDLQEE